MSTEYQLQDWNNAQVDVLTDQTSGLRIAVNRHGAELVSLGRRRPDGEWYGFLWRDGDISTPADGWKNHATVMGFFTHRIKDERSTYRGHLIHGGTHSFLRTKDFAAPGVSENSLTYSIGPGEIGPEEYPFKLQMDLTYSLVPTQKGPELAVGFDFHNLEPELSVHVSFGLHPGFAVASLAQARIIMPKGTYIQHMAPGNFLSGETLRIEHPGGPMPFKSADLPRSILIEHADVPGLFYEVQDPAGHRRTLLDYHEAPYVTIWSDGHDFVCIEPCWGLPDHHEQRPFEQKEGIQEIPPAGRLQRSFSIRPEITS